MAFGKSGPTDSALTCPTCGGALMGKNRLLLFCVGTGMGTCLSLAHGLPWFWAPGTVLTLTGFYLIVWATWAKGRWCRECKKFPWF